MKWEIAIFLFIVGLLVTSTVWFMLKGIRMDNNECLKSIAQDFCEDFGGAYGYHWWDFGEVRFNCVANARQVEPAAIYRFTEEEVERCLG